MLKIKIYHKVYKKVHIFVSIKMMIIKEIGFLKHNKLNKNNFNINHINEIIIDKKYYFKFYNINILLLLIFLLLL